MKILFVGTVGFSEKMLRKLLAKYRGSVIGSVTAEVFMSHREIT